MKQTPAPPSPKLWRTSLLAVLVVFCTAGPSASLRVNSGTPALQALAAEQGAASAPRVGAGGKLLPNEFDDAPSTPLRAGLREAVVRVEVASDPLSFGPGLVEELSARQARTPYERELLRRVRGVSTGSGFFVNAQGDLVTNAHVVMAGIRYRNLHFTHQEWESMGRVLETAKEVWVQVGEGENARYYLAKLMAVAEDLDLAALRLTLPPQEKREFAFLPILRSDGLATGQPVTALGFPEDEYRASQGHVVSFISGLEVHGGMRYTWFPDPVTGEETILVSGTMPGPIGRFQHTAPTAHGNSGGPVVDSRGRVVGVAYALLSEVNGNGEPRTDLNLAIASNILRGFLREHGIPFAEAAGE